ncbi:MAG: septum formation protein Maf [Lachnospiraceae bacterium]|nr:septum formation protein Maf [Lachnospiraceae bacterium]
MKKMILASGSPRRKELLTQIGFAFDVIPSTKEEVRSSKVPEELVQELSYQKAMDVAACTEEGRLVIGADTLVACEGQIMGKPEDKEQAAEMLRALSGNTHQVYTGVTVVMREGEDFEYFTFFEKTDVYVYELSEREIQDYIRTGEPMDKAGSYGIQGAFARYIKGICGDYNNVVGLPVARLYQELKKRGLAE